MSAVIQLEGSPRQLDRRPQPDEPVTKADVQDPGRLARLLFRVLKDLAAIKRRWWPQFVDHEDRAVDATGTTKHRFPHGLRGRVRWWVVDWTGATSGPELVRHPETDESTLVLVSYEAGTVSIRIQEAG